MPACSESLLTRYSVIFQCSVSGIASQLWRYHTQKLKGKSWWAVALQGAQQSLCSGTHADDIVMVCFKNRISIIISMKSRWRYLPYIYGAIELMELAQELYITADILLQRVWYNSNSGHSAPLHAPVKSNHSIKVLGRGSWLPLSTHQSHCNVITGANEL